MTATSTLEALLRRDRQVVVAALALVIGLSWAYLLTGAGMDMSALESTPASTGGEALSRSADASTDTATAGKAMSMTVPAEWSARYAVLMFFMWWIMMVAMMLPSATPMILLHTLVTRRAAERQHQPGDAQPAPTVATTAMFTGGYLATWACFGALATAAQWGLERSDLLSGMMASTSVALGAGVLIAAGLWQLTPLKHACLRHCRSPVHFLSAHWHPGPGGAFRMGVHHGAFCLGCCWVLMLLLFYGGVMNLYWIIGLALFVLLEKTIPAGHRLGRVTGIGLVAWGLWLLGSIR